MKANRTGGDPGGRGCGRVFGGSVRTGSWSEIPWTTRSSSQRVLLQNDHKSARIQANTTWLDMILYFQSAVGGRFCSQLGKTNFLSILTAQQPPVERNTTMNSGNLQRKSEGKNQICLWYSSGPLIPHPYSSCRFLLLLWNQRFPVHQGKQEACLRVLTVLY